jgi:hypothetical protein
MGVGEGALDGEGLVAELSFDIFEDGADEVIFERGESLLGDELGFGDGASRDAGGVGEGDGFAPLVAEGEEGGTSGFASEVVEVVPSFEGLVEELRVGVLRTLLWRYAVVRGGRGGS